MSKKTSLFLSFLFTAIGVATLHFNESTSAQHHAEFAERYGLPVPSYSQWILGTVVTVLGAIWFGHALGRKQKRWPSD